MKNNISEKLSFIIISSGIFLIPLFFLPFTPEDPFLVPKMVLLSVTALFALIAGFYPAGRLLEEKKDLLLASVVFLACMAVSIPGSTNYHEGLYELKRWALLFVLFIVSASINWTQKRLLMLVKVGMAAGLIVSLYAILEYFEILHFYLYPFQKRRLFSFFGHHNILAQYLTFAVLWGTAFTAAGETTRSRILGFAYVLVSGAALLLTFSRASIISTIFGLGILFFYLSGSKVKKHGCPGKSKYLFSAILIAFSALLLLIVITTKGEKVKGQALDMIERADSYRFTIWKDTAQIISKNPLRGVGLGNYPLVYPRYKTGPFDFLNLYAYNEPLHITAETGIIGLSGLVIFISMVLRHLKKNPVSQSNETKPLIAGIIAGLAATLLESMLSYNLHDATSSYFFFVSLGIICSWRAGLSAACLPVGRDRAGGETTHFHKRSVLNASALVIAVFIALWGIYGEYRKIMGHYCYSQALVFNLSNDTKKVFEYTQKSVIYQPHNPKYHYLAAALYLQHGQKESAERHFQKARELSPYVYGRSTKLLSRQQR